MKDTQESPELLSSEQIDDIKYEVHSPSLVHNKYTCLPCRNFRLN